ncbi:MAG TPA: alpha/beta hydrolase [Ilumatobacteraceae bacterium]|nr:alpha/beta hydrolase [Ilumatobacteraceae bacterium]
MTGREVHPVVERRTCIGANGVQLVADGYGDQTQPAVLLLHGGGQTRRSWGGTAETLSAAGFYAVTADLRGHGESGWDPSGDYTLSAHMGDVERWCAQLGRPAIVGASLGGMAGLWTEGTRASQGVESAGSCLVLVDIAHRADADGVARIRAFMHGNPDGFASIDEAADAVAGYLPHRPRPADTTGLARNLRLGDDGRYRWHWDPRSMGDGPRRGIDADVFEAFARNLHLPVLLVRGGRSDILSLETAAEFLSLVPHAEFVDVGGAHHMVAGDENDAFSTAVVDFLTRVAGRPT